MTHNLVIFSSALMVFVACALGCDDKAARDEACAMTGGGDAQHGVQLIRFYGCASCHQIPGVRGPDALVGPDLNHIAARNYVGSRLRNTPPNMIAWIKNPKAVDDKAGMPNLYVTESDARDIASYLYTLR